jgi:pimeloyl-ACP methyl ester carboxylesterase
MFERTLLLSPMLGPGAPTVRIGGDAWAQPFLPRILGLVVLERMGIHAFEHLPVLAFATAPERADILTSRYSFRLMRAFGTADYAADLRHATAPVAVLVGENDELFAASLFAPTVRAVRPDVPVTVIPGLNHIGMTTDPRAVPAIVAAVRGERQ